MVRLSNYLHVHVHFKDFGRYNTYIKILAKYKIILNRTATIKRTDIYSILNLSDYIKHGFTIFCFGITFKHHSAPNSW